MEDKKLLKNEELGKVTGGADPFPNDIARMEGCTALCRNGHESAYPCEKFGNHEFEFSSIENAGGLREKNDLCDCNSLGIPGDSPLLK